MMDEQQRVQPNQQPTQSNVAGSSMSAVPAVRPAYQAWLLSVILLCALGDALVFLALAASILLPFALMPVVDAIYLLILYRRVTRPVDEYAKWDPLKLLMWGGIAAGGKYGPVVAPILRLGIILWWIAQPLVKGVPVTGSSAMLTWLPALFLLVPSAALVLVVVLAVIHKPTQ
jgi:hypothetical protein